MLDGCARKLSSGCGEEVGIPGDVGTRVWVGGGVEGARQAVRRRDSRRRVMASFDFMTISQICTTER